MICKAKGQDKNYGSGNGSVQNCKFPFIYHDLKYSSGCAQSTEKGQGRLCATEVDAQGKLTKWARCNKYCGKDKGLNIIIILCIVNWTSIEFPSHFYSHDEIVRLK